MDANYGDRASSLQEKMRAVMAELARSIFAP